MKILIITYSREVNPGTFLQAYGVQYVFHQLYPDAQIDLIKHKRMYSIIAEGKNANLRTSKFAFFKAKVCAIPRRLKYEWAYYTKFHLTEQEFDFFDYDDAEFKKFAEGYDLIVVGSDTILINLKRNGHYGLMWLHGIDTQKILFAASASPANFNLTKEDVAQLYKSFSSFLFLGVRDSVTLSLLHDRIGLGDKAFRIFDPTYMVPASMYHIPWITKYHLESIRKHKKIALVNFGKGFVGTKTITETLKQKGYHTIATLYNQWADTNLMTLSPFEWGALFKYVDLTVSDSFHNCVFTFMNNKPAIAVDWKTTRFSSDGSSKTKDLMHIYNLEDFHYLYNEKDGIDPIFDKIRLAENSFDKDKTIAGNKLIADNYQSLLKKIGSTIK